MLNVYCDGSHKSGVGGMGVVLDNKNGFHKEFMHYSEDLSSSIESEYSSVILGMELALYFEKKRDVFLFNDSIYVNRILNNGDKNSNFKNFKRRITELNKEFGRIRYFKIDRRSAKELYINHYPFYRRSDKLAGDARAKKISDVPLEVRQIGAVQ